MVVLVIISFIILAAYVTVACLKLGGVPESFWDVTKAWSWPLLTLWFVAAFLAIPLLAPELIDRTSDGTRWLAFLSLASAVIAAFYPSLGSKTDVDGKIITVASWAFVVLSTAVIAFNCWWLLLAWVPLFVLFFLGRLPKHRFWLPVACIVIYYIYSLI